MTEQQETVSVVQSEALLPCPFCGASAEWRDDPGVCDVLYGLVVIHTSGCFLNSVCFAKTDAITAWNQRTRNSDVSGDVVERHFEIVVGKKQARATVGERELIRLINGGAKIWQIASLPQQRPAVELKGPFPEKSPFGEVGCYGSPDAYLIDPGAGSASDQVSRFWPSRRQLNDIHERDGSITPLYGSRNSLTPDQQAAMAEGEETGWLIEHGSHAAPMYWTGKSWGRWSGDHRDACRFARREDAFKVSLAIGDMPNDSPHKIVEHKWISK